MPKDPRIFRVTRKNGKVEYCNRTSVSGKTAVSHLGYHAARATIAAIHATNPEATDGWTDVTQEFLGPPRAGRCCCHPHYQGTAKPQLRNPTSTLCTCWSVYLDRHPDCPGHSVMCDRRNSDPQTCPCRPLAKLAG